MVKEMIFHFAHRSSNSATAALFDKCRTRSRLRPGRQSAATYQAAYASAAPITTVAERIGKPRSSHPAGALAEGS